ncbi:MAG TPA: serpin family protein [Candidatus Nanoarchaeia archaeon]|nr:serpin family protein [Candidatus Nanoarchaeia archaeon]
MDRKFAGFFLAVVIVLSLFLNGCEKQSVPIVDDAKATSEGINNVVNANNQFAFDLYSEFKDKNQNKNIFFSPYSISLALTMTYEGAKGQTAEEMESVLHIPKEAGLRRPNFAKIYNDINKKDKKYKLSTANALWAQKEYKFLEDYTGTVEKYYGGKVTNLDFVKESEKSSEIINSWIEEQTNGKIKDLIPPGVLNADTKLVLTNAIYFKGTWVKQFDKKDTQNEDFTISPGQTAKVPMMRLAGGDSKFSYAETDEIQILEMPYDGEDLSMLVILPKENNLGKTEASVNLKKLSEWKGMLKEQRVDIFIPRFKFETKYFMVETLKDLGIHSAFSGADFSGIDGTKSLFISDVIHQAFVEVNEEGTEAAAATAVVAQTTSVGPRIPVFRADRPFIFIIQQKDTGNILFLGKVNNPNE